MLIKRLGKWVLLYLAIKWTILAGAIFWLTQFAWFRMEYLLVLPALVLSIVLVRKLLTNRAIAARKSDA